MIGYVPTGLAVVAVVDRLAAPLTTLGVSPLTKPVIVSVKVGLAARYSRLASLAVTVSVSGVTVSVPGFRVTV